MQPGMVYEYSLWSVGLLFVGLAALGAVFLDLAFVVMLAREHFKGEGRQLYRNRIGSPRLQCVGRICRP